MALKHGVTKRTFMEYLDALKAAGKIEMPSVWLITAEDEVEVKLSIGFNTSRHVNGKLVKERRCMKHEQVSEPDEIRFKNIVGMGLDFSSMIRLFEKGSDDKLCDKIVKDTWDKIRNVKSKEEFDHVHQDFCDWGTRNIILAEKKKRDGSVIKRRKPASYGQIVKTLNVTLKVMVYYCQLAS